MPSPLRTHVQKSNSTAPLNTVLTYLLTAINQYFLHARILKHKNEMTLADYEYRASLINMKLADKLVERILSLGGLPMMEHAESPRIGKTSKDALANDLELEGRMHAQVEQALALCKAENDLPTADILQSILDNQQEHMQEHMRFMQMQCSA